MTWQIFKRLFWKVWREDWLKWASVLGAGVVVICITQARSKDSAALWLIPIIYITTALSAWRGRRDSLNSDTTGSISKLPSVTLITIWGVIYALIFTACISEFHEKSLMISVTFMLTWFVSVNVVGYALGRWIHPWLPAIFTTLPFILALADFIGSPCYTNPTYISFPELHMVNVAVTSIVILTISLIVSVRFRSRIPTIMQLIIAVSMIVIFITELIRNINDDFEHFGTWGSCMTADRTIDAAQSPVGIITLNDDKTGNTYKLNIKKKGDWDRVIPVGICRGEYVSVIALNSKKNLSSITRWNYIKGGISVITTINSSRYDFICDSDTPDCYSASDDGRYILLRLRSRIGRGRDYIIIDIPARTTRMIMANEPNIYGMSFISSQTISFVDAGNVSARVLHLGSMKLSPVIRWMESNKR